MKKKKYNFSALMAVFFIFSSLGYSQNKSSLLTKEISLGGYITTSDKTPLLNKANQYGIVPIDGNTFFFNGKIEKAYDSTKNNLQKLKKIDYSFGFEVQTNPLSNNALILPQAFIAGRFKGFELYAGRKKEFFGLADTTGVFRSYIWSGNALPIPQVQIGTPNYIPILGQGFLSAKLGFGHGWFGKQTYTEDYFLHSKWLFLKIGRNNQLINLIAELNHFAQWGGYSETFKDDTKSTVNGYLSQDLYVYSRVVLPYFTTVKPKKSYPFWDTANHFGNHLGSFDYGIEINTSEGKISLLRQIGFEDSQAYDLFFALDGNYTLMFTKNENGFIKKAGIEVLNTRNQAASLSKLAQYLNLTSKHPGEDQNYLNHGQYLDGWSYNGNAIGTVGIIPIKELNTTPSNSKSFSNDNSVLAFSANIGGQYSESSYSIKTGYIMSYGCGGFNQRKTPLKQFSGQISYSAPLNWWDLRSGFDIAVDRGEIYGNQIGLNITLTKSL